MTKNKPTINVRLNLYNLLKEKGLSVDEAVDLCNKAGYPITRTTIYNKLDPHSKTATAIQMSTITALCGGLDIDPCDLFTVEKVA